MKTNFAKLSVLFSMFALVAMSLTSCSKNDDGSNTPITPEPEAKAVATFVGAGIQSEILDILDVTVTHIDGNGKETPCQFTVFDEKNQDHQWAKKFNNTWLNAYGTTASIVYATVSGTTAKSFTNKFNIVVKQKEGCQLKEQKHVTISVHRGVVGSKTNEIYEGIYFNPGQESRLVNFINSFFASNAQYTTEAK